MMSEVQTKKSVHQLNKPAIICTKCQRTFTRRTSLYCHMRKFHPGENINLHKGRVCGICREKVKTLSELFAHIIEKHKISLQFTEETFYCEDDFLKWKSETERENGSNFIIRHTSGRRHKELKVRYYECYRSGFKEQKESKKDNIKRRKRTTGSIKIGFTCPACMNVVSEIVDGISCIKVRYQSLHVGHEFGVKFRLSKEDKARLASALSSGISISNLLKELRDNYDPSHPYRQVTRKDLANISQAFKLSKIVEVQRDDLVAVDIVVKQILNCDLQSSLLVYKPVGETLAEYPALNKNDFLLGIMNDVQEKLLEMYGNKCIMIDYSNCEKFYLSTVMVRDENNESLSVATFFSSKISLEILQPFFYAIQMRLPQLKAKIIITDDVVSLYDAWQKVFKDESQHLICSLYVLRNLFRNVEHKVNKENRKRMKERLKSILKEENIDIFELSLQMFLNEYKEEEKDFITYFETMYNNRTKKWAYCHRIAVGINPDLRLDRWRDQLKLEEKGTNSKRLEKTLFLVCSTIAKKLISNSIVMDMEKLSARTLLCQKLHEESSTMGDECNVVKLSDKRCTISETMRGKVFFYVMEKFMEFCGCGIKCETCNICIHSMSCTCMDYCVHFVICRHMHRFCGLLTPVSEQIICSQGSDDSCSFFDNEPIPPLEDAKVTEPISDPQFIIDDIKERIKVQWEVLERRLEDVNYLEAIKNVEERMNSINFYLDEVMPSCSFYNEVPKT